MSEPTEERSPSAETARPEAWENPDPERFHFEPMSAGSDWQLVDPPKQCRMLSGAAHVRCPNQAVAMLRRRRRTAHSLYGSAWWAYCAEHMYGRWVEDGQVWQWRLVHNDEEQA